MKIKFVNIVMAGIMQKMIKSYAFIAVLFKKKKEKLQCRKVLLKW